MSELLFQTVKRDPDTRARSGRLTFPSGVVVETPAFMPVGTRASVRGLWQEELEEIGYRLILANTYHLELRPGARQVAALGGVKKFMSWNDGVLLTDSGGFQAFSLAERVKMRDDGIEFKSHLDGSPHLFTPTGVLGIQRQLGSDIMMVLDDCAPGDADQKRLREALERTHNWARISIEEHRRYRENHPDAPPQFCFGIIQGGIDPEMRRESTAFIQELPFDGIAVGGLSVGESRESFYETLDVLAPHLDENRPRYLMGVGAVWDLMEAIRAGFDMFDCVLPTRNARNGQVFSHEGKLNLRNAKYAMDSSPIDELCNCRVCRRYSRAYLRHLFSNNEMLGPQMATYHNLHFLYHLMRATRIAIAAGHYADFYRKWKSIPF